MTIYLPDSMFSVGYVFGLLALLGLITAIAQYNFRLRKNIERETKWQESEDIHREEIDDTLENVGDEELEEEQLVLPNFSDYKNDKCYNQLVEEQKIRNQNRDYPGQEIEG